MQKQMLICGLLIALWAPARVMAQIGITGTLGSTGVGAHVSLPIQPNLHARLGINYINYSYNSSTRNVDYDLRLKLRTVDALLEFFPSGNALRLSAGLIYNGNKIDAVGVPSTKGTYTLNGTTYSAANAGTVVGRIDFRKAAPYLGIGWGKAAQSLGWGFSADLGVMFQGAAETTLRSTGCNAPALLCARLATDIAAENRSLSDKVDDYKAFPVLRVGLSYRFN
ncbi:MAG: hypothetical protein V4754_06500 [Pseudomonadota bacterium]